MAVEQAEIDELQRLAANMRDDDSLLPLVTIPEVLGFVIATARAEGRDECDDVERVVRGAALDRKTVNKAGRVLRALGYLAVADMLRSVKLPRRKSSNRRESAKSA
jgi:hypothetical protein